MTTKTYELTESQRATVHELLEWAMMNTINEASLIRIGELSELFKTPHPVDEVIIGREAILAHLKERGFKGREPDALMMFTWGPAVPHWHRIINGLNQFDVVTRLLRTPNIGAITVRQVLLRCIAHGWIRDASARRAVDRFLTDTAPRRKS